MWNARHCYGSFHYGFEIIDLQQEHPVIFALQLQSVVNRDTIRWSKRNAGVAGFPLKTIALWYSLYKKMFRPDFWQNLHNTFLCSQQSNPSSPTQAVWV